MHWVLLIFIFSRGVAVTPVYGFNNSEDCYAAANAAVKIGAGSTTPLGGPDGIVNAICVQQRG